MKRVIILLICLTLLAPVAFGGNGSLLVLKNTYFYKNRNKKGKRLLTRKRQAYEVVSISKSSKSHMFKVRVYSNKNIVNESGFVIETDPELRALGQNKIRVFAEIPSIKSDLTNFKLVPSNQLSFTGRKEMSKDFPHLTWRAVNYKANAPEEYWIAAWSGIYRPNKEARWLNKTYKRALSSKINQQLLLKILRGLVETGYTKEQVRLALGEPLKEQIAKENAQLEWIYSDRKVIFKNEKVMQVL